MIALDRGAPWWHKGDKTLCAAAPAIVRIRRGSRFRARRRIALRRASGAAVSAFENSRRPPARKAASPDRRRCARRFQNPTRARHSRHRRAGRIPLRHHRRIGIKFGRLATVRRLGASSFARPSDLSNENELLFGRENVRHVARQGSRVLPNATARHAFVAGYWSGLVC